METDSDEIGNAILDFTTVHVQQAVIATEGLHGAAARGRVQEDSQGGPVQAGGGGAGLQVPGAGDGVWGGHESGPPNDFARPQRHGRRSGTACQHLGGPKVPVVLGTGHANDVPKKDGRWVSKDCWSSSETPDRWFHATF